MLFLVMLTLFIMSSRISKIWLAVVAVVLGAGFTGRISGASFNEAAIPPRLSMIRSNNGVVRINYQGQTNFLFVVQTSSNMVSWTAVNTNIMTNGVMGYVDTAATNQAQRFYSATTLRTPLFYYGTNSGAEAGKFLLLIRTNNVGTLLGVNTARNTGERALNLQFDADGRYCGPLFANASGCLQVTATNITGTYTNTAHQTGSITATNRYNYGAFRNAAGLYTASFSGAGVCPGTIQALVSADGEMFFYIINTAGTYTDASFAQAQAGNGSFGNPNPPPGSFHVFGTLNAITVTIAGSYLHACPDEAGAGPISLSKPEKAF